VTNEAKETATWTIDLKKTGTVYKGSATPKADVTIILSDDTLTDLASGKVRFPAMFLWNH
jgi:putative sterol carrier protein